MPINWTWLVKLFLPLIENAGKDALVKLLNNLHEAHAVTYEQVVTSIYPVIDIQLENYVKETKNTIDDEVVKKLKEAFEESAAATGVKLPNLDSD